MPEVENYNLIYLSVEYKQSLFERLWGIAPRAFRKLLDSGIYWRQGHENGNGPGKAMVR